MCGRLAKTRTPVGWRTVEGFLALAKKNAGKPCVICEKPIQKGQYACMVPQKKLSNGGEVCKIAHFSCIEGSRE